MNLIFGRFQTGILQATQAVNIKFKLEKNQVHQTRYVKLEFCNNQTQIDKGILCLLENLNFTKAKLES